MKFDVVIPHLGATGGDVTLVEWLVREGAFVKRGTPMFVVETDKATDEVPAFRDGFVRRLLVAAGTQVEPGAVVAMLTDAVDEALEDQAVGASATAAPAPTPSPTTPPAAPAGHFVGKVLASPRAKRLAADHGIDLREVVASGADGIVQACDVQQAIRARAIGLAPTTRDRSPLTARRRAVAESTSRSKSEIPHFYVTIDVDMVNVVQLRQRYKSGNGDAACPSLTDFIVTAAGRALRKSPQLNAEFLGTEIAYATDCDIGLVVGLDDGVVVPVIRAADRITASELAGITKSIVQRAKAGELTSADITGGSLAISNLGMFGVSNFIAVIQPKQSAVLACGAVTQRPIVVDSQIVARWQATFTLSVDHRLADGVAAAKFMQAFKDLLEHPEQLDEAV